VLEDVAEAYEEIYRRTGWRRNPSAAGRAQQLREIVAKLFEHEAESI
jgi:hypothetical protein